MYSGNHEADQYEKEDEQAISKGEQNYFQAEAEVLDGTLAPSDVLDNDEIAEMVNEHFVASNQTSLNDMHFYLIRKMIEKRHEEINDASNEV